MHPAGRGSGRLLLLVLALLLGLSLVAPAVAQQGSPAAAQGETLEQTVARIGTLNLEQARARLVELERRAAIEDGGSRRTFQIFFLLFTVFAVGLVLRWLWQVRTDFTAMFGSSPDVAKLTIYRDAQAGLPQGTIRAALALVVVGVALPGMLFSRQIGLESTGELGTLLGGILGFYFGTRSGSGDADAFRSQANEFRGQAEEERAKAKKAEEEKDNAVATRWRVEQRRDQDVAEAGAQAAEKTGRLTEARETLATLRVGIEAATRVLAPDLAGTAREVLNRVDGGLAAAERAAGGDPAAIAAAAEHAAGLAGAVLGRDNPLTGVLGDAVSGLRTASSLAALAGVGGPAGLLVGVAFGAVQAIRKGEEHYRRWKARIIDRPYTFNLFPADPLDGAMCLAALEQARILRPGLLDALAAGDPMRLVRARDACQAAQLPDEQARERLIEIAGGVEPWASDDEFVAGLNELRRIMLDTLLERTEAGQPAPAVAGLDIAVPEPLALRTALDRLREERGAKGLDPALLLLTGLAENPDMTQGRLATLLTTVLPAVLSIANATTADEPTEPAS